MLEAPDSLGERLPDRRGLAGVGNDIGVVLVSRPDSASDLAVGHLGPLVVLAGAREAAVDEDLHMVGAGR